MTDTLNALVHDIDNGLPALEAVGIRGVDAEQRAELLQAGFLGLVPLWTDSGVAAGLLAAPEVPFGDWVGVAVREGQALTLSANANTLLPRFLLARYLSNDAESADRVARRLDQIVPALSEVHARLGGEDETLQSVLNEMVDPGRRAAFSLDPDHAEAFEEAHSRLSRSIDGSATFGRYADWIDATVAHGEASPKHVNYGPWSRQIYARAFELAASSGEDIVVPPAEVALDLIEAFAGLDTAVPKTPGWELRAGEGSGAAMLVRFARRITDDALPDDDVARGLLHALQAGRLGYLGDTHAESVVVLDERGDAVRAWAALHSAAWWMGRNAPEASPPMLDGARLLCERHGWNELRWVLDRNAGEIS